jgi:hypothetical protein
MSVPIFISFASADRIVAETVCRAVENRGFTCWIATRDIHPGENFQESIVHAIHAAKVMVFVFTDNSNNSHEVKKEVALASRQNLLVIPMRVEDVTPSAAFDYELSTRQWIDAYDDWESAIHRLVQHLTEVVGPPFSPAAFADALPQDVTAGANNAGPEPATVAPAHETTAPRALSQPGTSEAPGEAKLPQQPETALANRSVPASRRLATSWLIPLGGAGVLAVASIAVWFGVFAGKSSSPSPVTNVAPATTSPAVIAQTATPQPAPPPRATVADTLLRGNAALEHQDYAEAMRLYRPPADQGNPAAQNNVGWLYQNGWGVPQDYAEAVRWYLKAADRGNAAAQTSLGWLYQNGWGIKQDYAEAMRWYRMAADQGNAAAQTKIGGLYSDGLGVPRDQGQAQAWMQKAAAGGSDGAKKWLAAHP